MRPRPGPEPARPRLRPHRELGAAGLRGTALGGLLGHVWLGGSCHSRALVAAVTCLLWWLLSRSCFGGCSHTLGLVAAVTPILGGSCHTRLVWWLLLCPCFGGSWFGGCCHALGLVTPLVFCSCCSAPRCQSERPQDGQEREGRRQPLPSLVPRYSVLDAVTWVRSEWRGLWCLQASGCLLCPAGRAAGWDTSLRPSCGHTAFSKQGSQRQHGSSP